MTGGKAKLRVGLIGVGRMGRAPALAMQSLADFQLRAGASTAAGAAGALKGASQSSGSRSGVSARGGMKASFVLGR